MFDRVMVLNIASVRLESPQCCDRFHSAATPSLVFLRLVGGWDELEDGAVPDVSPLPRYGTETLGFSPGQHDAPRQSEGEVRSTEVGAPLTAPWSRARPYPRGHCNMYHDRDRGFLRITLTGTVTIDMLVTAFHEVVRHPAGQPGMTLLWDFRRASFGGLTITASPGSCRNSWQIGRRSLCPWKRPASVRDATGPGATSTGGLSHGRRPRALGRPHPR
jgi:hypothetical protein